MMDTPSNKEDNNTTDNDSFLVTAVGVNSSYSRNTMALQTAAGDMPVAAAAIILSF